MKNRNYKVELTRVEGSCKEKLFEKMAKNGDIQATKVQEIIGEKITVKGLAEAVISSAEKTFNIYYIDTEEFGIVSTGSTIFYSSITTYLEDTNKFYIKEVKTKMGKTYKASPELTESISE